MSEEIRDDNNEGSENPSQSEQEAANSGESATLQDGQQDIEQEAVKDSSESADEQLTRFDKHPRFQELIKKNKENDATISELKKQVEDMKSRMADNPEDVTQSDKEDYVEQYAKKLVDAGVNPKVASLLAQENWGMIQRATEPLNNQFKNMGYAAQVREWESSQGKDYTPEIGNAMSETFKKLDQRTRNLIKETGENGLNFLKSITLGTKPPETPAVDKTLGQAIGKRGGKSDNFKDVEYYRTLTPEGWDKLSEPEYEHAVQLLGIRS